MTSGGCELDVFRRRGAPGPAAPSRHHLLSWRRLDHRPPALSRAADVAADGVARLDLLQHPISAEPARDFPDHIVDVKRALAWVHAHAARVGRRPRLASSCQRRLGGRPPGVAGGAHARRSRVAARLRRRRHVGGRLHRLLRRLRLHQPLTATGAPACACSALERWVMKAALRPGAGAGFEAASPLAHVGAHAPPFLVAARQPRHGGAGRKRRGNLSQPCSNASAASTWRSAGAQHAFEIFPSLRTLAVLDGVERFLEGTRWPEIPSGNQPPPETLRRNVASVYLRLAALGRVRGGR